MTAVGQRCIVVGTGRAGGAFALALSRAGWDITVMEARPLVLGTVDPNRVERIVSAADLVLIAVTDSAISRVATALPATAGVVAHVSGASGLDVLAPHRRVASIHPLMSLPDAQVGAARLGDHCTFAVDGDPIAHEVVASLVGRGVTVPDSKRARYHAAASIAANHLTALCAQVDRLARDIDVPVDAYWTLMSTTLENIAAVGPAAALTGPAARADWPTVRAHLAALPSDDDRRFYIACCTAAARMAGHNVPVDIAVG